MPSTFAQRRELMVEQQVRPWEVLDPRVLAVISRMPREAFLPEGVRELAYTDTALPIGQGQYTWKPVVEGRALQALLPQPNDAVLEIGSGSGYLTACLAQLAGDVHGLELDPTLAAEAAAALQAQGIGNAQVEVADALTWGGTRRFDVICVGDAVAHMPARFGQWLAPGGRMFVVRGEAPAMEAVLVQADGGTQSLFETELPYLVGAQPAQAFTL